MKRVFRVYMPSNWKEGECTCPDFLKNYKCEHYLGVAIRLKRVDPPSEEKSVPLDEKRPCGRPKKVKSALSKK